MDFVKIGDVVKVYDIWDRGSGPTIGILIRVGDEAHLAHSKVHVLLDSGKLEWRFRHEISVL